MTALRVFLVAGEHSGDALGAGLMDGLSRTHEGAITYAGVGGEAMAERGLESLFPLSDVAVMGPLSILPRLPRITRRVYRTVDAALAFDPDIVVIIDSPEFTHPIAKRIRRRRPDIPIIDYVSPSVWAWRPGRAQKMTAYVDHVLALLPFEPEAHARLGGPPCTYVGHPLIERLPWIDALDAPALARRLGIADDVVPIVVLPGSRASEVDRLIDVFGASLSELSERGVAHEVLMPAVPHLRETIAERTRSWPCRVHVLGGEADKFAAFKLARAALAASGTVTLELGLVQTPMVVAYRVDPIAVYLRFLIKVHSVVLANLVLGENAFPEFLQEDCQPGQLADALAAIVADGPARQAQLAALSGVAAKLVLPSGTPSGRAAEVVLGHVGSGRN